MDGRWHILILFAGPPERKDGLAAFLRKLGCAVTEIDVRIGGAEHDVLDQWFNRGYWPEFKGASSTRYLQHRLANLSQWLTDPSCVRSYIPKDYRLSRRNGDNTSTGTIA